VVGYEYSTKEVLKERTINLERDQKKKKKNKNGGVYVEKYKHNRGTQNPLGYW